MPQSHALLSGRSRSPNDSARGTGIDARRRRVRHRSHDSQRAVLFWLAGTGNPTARHKLLPGISMAVLSELAAGLGIDLTERDITPAESPAQTRSCSLAPRPVSCRSRVQPAAHRARQPKRRSSRACLPPGANWFLWKFRPRPGNLQHASWPALTPRQLPEARRFWQTLPTWFDRGRFLTHVCNARRSPSTCDRSGEQSHLQPIRFFQQPPAAHVPHAFSELGVMP